MRSLGRLAVLTEELALQYSPIILKALSCMQQANACQPDSPSLPHTEAPSQTDGAHSHQIPSLEHGADAAAVEAEAEPHAKAVMKGTTSAEAEPGAEALMEGPDAGSAADAVWPVTNQTTGHKGSPEMPSGYLQAVQNRETSSLHSQATTAEQACNAACTSPLSSPGMTATAMTTSSSAAQAALGAAPLPPAPATTAASLKQVLPHASEPAQAAATTSAAGPAAASESEAALLEAVSAAAALMEAFPHLLDDLGDTLGHQLRCAIGEVCFSFPLVPPLPPALAALASTTLQVPILFAPFLSHPLPAATVLHMHVRVCD